MDYVGNWKDRINACEDAASLYALAMELINALEVAEAAEAEARYKSVIHQGAKDLADAERRATDAEVERDRTRAFWRDVADAALTVMPHMSNSHGTALRIIKRYAEMEKACFCPCHKGTGDAQCKVNAGFEQLLLKYMALVGEEEGVYFLRRCEGKDIVSLAGHHGEIILSVEEQRTLLRIAHELSGE